MAASYCCAVTPGECSSITLLMLVKLMANASQHKQRHLANRGDVCCDILSSCEVVSSHFD